MLDQELEQLKRQRGEVDGDSVAQHFPCVGIEDARTKNWTYTYSKDSSDLWLDRRSIALHAEYPAILKNCLTIT